MDEQQFNERDQLAWSRFMLANILLIALQDTGTSEAFEQRIRDRLSRTWEGLGAQGVEGALISMRLTLEALGCRILSVQTSPESSEIVVEPFPGTRMLQEIEDRFEIQMSSDDWYELLQTDYERANSVYDILAAIADGAGVEFLREPTDDGDVRLVVRAW